MDRGYLHAARLIRFTHHAAFFVIRSMEKLKYKVLDEHASPEGAILKDERIVLTGRYTKVDYPLPLRRVCYFDAEHNRVLTFLTNNFQLPGHKIALLYKSRWQVELFFKWIKQNLRIKAFLGNSLNAVKTQIWIAISTYVLVAIVRKRLQLDVSMHTALQILSLSLFELTPLSDLLAASRFEDRDITTSPQFSLFENISGQ